MPDVGAITNPTVWRIAAMLEGFRKSAPNSAITVEGAASSIG